MDWENIRELFIRWLDEFLKEQEGSAQELYSFVVNKLKEELAIAPEVEQKIREWANEETIKLYKAIQDIVEIAMIKGTGSLVKDDVIMSIAQEVIDYRYPDGLDLSQRLWHWSSQVKLELRNVLRELIKTRTSAQQITYELQYALERIHDKEFVLTTLDKLPQYLEAVKQSAKTFQAPALEKSIRRALKQIEKLKTTQNIANVKQFLKDVMKAVEKADEELIEKAVQWWLYNRQLYRLNTISRTELANAFHLSQITATEDDEEIIGYQWRLSASHPRHDICDVYATVDYGLGKGVFPKDKVPRRKPHPHCLCYLVPKMRKKHHRVKEEAEIDRAVLMKFAPKWIKRLVEEEGRDILEFWDMERGRFLTRDEASG